MSSPTDAQPQVHRTNAGGVAPEEARTCRICHGTDGPLSAPCDCSGSLRWVHSHCLTSWLQIRRSRSRADPECEVCRYKFQLGPVQAPGLLSCSADFINDNGHFLLLLLLPFFSPFGMSDSIVVRLLFTAIFYYATLAHHNITRFTHSLLHQYAAGLCIIMTAGFMIKGGYVWTPHPALVAIFPLPAQLFRLDVDIHLFVLPVCLSNFLWIPLGVTSVMALVAVQLVFGDISLWPLLESYQAECRLAVSLVYAAIFMVYGWALAYGARVWLKDWREDQQLARIVERIKNKEQ